MVGQMFVVSVGGTEPDYYIEKMVRERNIGGVVLFSHNMQSETQTRALTASLQDLSLKTEPAVPLFVAVDQEGGTVAHAPWVSPQPAAAKVGARGNPAEARAIAEKMGRELLTAGVNTNLAPVVDTGFRGHHRHAVFRRGSRTGLQDGGCGRRGLREGRRRLLGQALPEPRPDNLRLARGPAGGGPRPGHDSVQGSAAVSGGDRGRGAHGHGRPPPVPGHRPQEAGKPLSSKQLTCFARRLASMAWW